MEPRLHTCFVKCRQVATHPEEKKTNDGWMHVGADGETHADPNNNRDRKRRGRHPAAEARHAPRRLHLEKLWLQS